MRAFSDLIDRLIYTRSRNTKLRLIADYLRATPDPDRGWALAALTDSLDFAHVKPAVLRGLIEERVDPLLFRLSRDFVGDTAETIALLWPEPFGQEKKSHPQPLHEGVEGSQIALVSSSPPGLPGGVGGGSSSLRLADVVDTLRTLGKAEAPRALAAMLDRLDSNERYALLKMATGNLRIGVSSRLAKTALAQGFDLPVDEVEEVWHAVAPPYALLFDWATGKIAQPSAADTPVFRAFMLAHPLDDTQVDLADYVAEWKWDGIRVQIVRVADQVRLYSRGGDDVTGSFPDVARAVTVDGVFDGELLVRGEVQGGTLEDGGGAASFNALQQRLGRKVVSPKMLADYPAFVRLYDILFDGAEDVRALPWAERRARLEVAMPRFDPERFDVSAVVEAASLTELEEMRAGARDAAIEGLMLKRRDSPYVAGRRVGLWYKWKREPLTADCVMMYAQRGNGRRSSYYSDYTFGCWTAPPEEGGELLPVGKAYSGVTDEEMRELDKFIRQNTTARFGPVREVAKSMVLEVAFDSIHRSTRHKSGIAMRFPRIARIRRDKPAAEADLVATLAGQVT